MDESHRAAVQAIGGLGDACCRRVSRVTKARIVPALLGLVPVLVELTPVGVAGLLIGLLLVVVGSTPSVLSWVVETKEPKPKK